jgi:3-deoxy-D-manno-octulosonate 8-phosphate phosphatase (KDO 8-P phosphatase)
VHLDHPERLAGPLGAFLRGEVVGDPVEQVTSLAASSAPPSQADAIAAQVRVLVLDVDGVLTDGSLVYDASGEAQKVFDVRDGLGIKLVQEAGIEVAILSGRATAAVDARARDLGIAHVHQGVKDKPAVLSRLLETLAVTDAQVAYMGDDLVDLGVLARVGLAAAPADARPEARRLARFVARAPGGRGAVRELCEHLLRARGVSPVDLRSR